MKKRVFTVAMIIGLMMMNIMPVTAAEKTLRYDPSSYTCIYCQKAKMYRISNSTCACGDNAIIAECPECGAEAIICVRGHWTRTN